MAFLGNAFGGRKILRMQASYDNYDAFIKDGLAAERWKEYRRKEKPSMSADDWKEYQIKTAAGWVPEDLPLPPFAGKALTHISTIFYDDWLNLYNQKADILVTHEAPCCHPYGFAGLTELARGMKVKKSFHGHHHDRMDYSSHNDRLGFEAHAVGYRGISDQNGVLIKPGDYDYLRSHRNVVTDN